MTEPTRFRRGLVAALVALASTAPVDGADGGPDPAPGIETPVPVRTLLSRLPESLDGWRAEGMEGAIAMQMFPMVGREDLVARFGTTPAARRACPARDGEPIGTIVEQARDARLVIVNEAHDQPLHREVIRQIGLQLADRFSVFAAETFDRESLASRQDGRIPDTLGSYSDDPIFGRELRALEAAGYRFAAYEIRDEQMAPEPADRAEQVIRRETAQADNFIAGILDTDPEARVLVHVGYSHALEVPVDNWGREIAWFAARLKARTGIDPLTVSQTHCSLEDSDEDNALDGLRLADGADALERPGAIDLMIAHPPLRFDRGRPAWRRATGDRDVDLPGAFIGHPERIVIEARAPGEGLDEVPIERLLLYPGESLPLLLPPGDWQLTSWTAEGEVTSIDLVVDD